MTVSPVAAVLDRNGLDALVKALTDQGRTVVGPTVRDGAVILAELASADQLPFGWGTEVEAGRYRLVPREDGAAFAHSTGPHPGRRSCTRSGRGCGAWTVRRTDACRSPKSVRSSRRTPSSACVPATCVPSRSRTGSWPEADTGTAAIRNGGQGPS